jgi:hypothetical protein
MIAVFSSVFKLLRSMLAGVPIVPYSTLQDMQGRKSMVDVGSSRRQVSHSPDENSVARKDGEN